MPTLSALALTLSVPALAAPQASFTPIPNPSGQPGSNSSGCFVSGGNGYSTVRVSADGGTVALTLYQPGAANGAIPREFGVWSEARGTEVIAPDIGLGASFGWGVTGISADGSFVCGPEWVWRRSSGYQSLEPTLNAFGYAALFGCSDDGAVVAGFRPSNIGLPFPGDYFRWQLGVGAPQLLPREAAHPEGYFLFNCISGDGRIVGGHTFASSAPFGQSYAGVLVTAAGATLITPESAGNATLVNDLSYDGSVAVGQVSLAGPLGGFGLDAFRWTAATGLQVLPSPGTTSAASACDARGETIVGSYLVFGIGGTRAFLWDAQRGSVDLQDELVTQYGLGAALQGWTILVASDISADGSVIVGSGINPAGCEQAFVVRLPAPQVGSNYCTATPNSTGSPSTLRGLGSASVARNGLTLAVSGLPSASFGFFLTSATPGFTTTPGGSRGNLCLGGPIGRYVGAGQIQNSGSAGEFSLRLDLTRTPTPLGVAPILAGETRRFQAWHRDRENGQPTSNFTPGLVVTFVQ